MTTFRRRSGFALRRTARSPRRTGRRSGRRRQSRERPRFEVVVTLVQDRKGTLGGHALRRFLARPRTRGEQFAVHRDLGVKGPLVRGARRHLRNGEPVLYDLSSSYFEGRCCPLAVHGYSRDQRRGSLQIVYGLMCDRVGDRSPSRSLPATRSMRRRFATKSPCCANDGCPETDVPDMFLEGRVVRRVPSGGRPHPVSLGLRARAVDR